MVRLIDADELIELMCAGVNNKDRHYAMGVRDVLDCVDDLPTITRSQLRRMVLSEEEPVKHAHKVDVTVESGIERWMMRDKND